MRANSLGRFVLRVIAWLPLTFAVWYLAAPLFVWPVAVLSEVVTRTAFGDLVKTVEQNGPLLNFVTSLRPGQATSGPKIVSRSRATCCCLHSAADVRCADSRGT
jgi:hypothetical protein